MSADERPHSRVLSRSLGRFQESVQKSGPAASASYSLIGAIMLLGGLGYALTCGAVVAVGLILGLLLG